MELSLKGRSPELTKALNYLLTTFPSTRVQHLNVKFMKKDYVNNNANADYESVQFQHNDTYYFESNIRVAQGEDKFNPKALTYLFHEYKHLLQDDAGYLYGEKTKHLNHCIEAEAWAIEQVAIYKELL